MVGKPKGGVEIALVGELNFSQEASASASSDLGLCEDGVYSVNRTGGVCSKGIWWRMTVFKCSSVSCFDICAVTSGSVSHHLLCWEDIPVSHGCEWM